MRLFQGELNEIVDIERIEQDYAEYLQSADCEEPTTFAEYLQNVTGSGGYWLEVACITMSLADFLQKAEMQTISEIHDTEMFFMDHSLPGVLYVIGNSDDYAVTAILQDGGRV